MFFYLVCFISSTVLFWLGQYLKLEKSTEPFRCLVYGAALLFPAILAGLRDVSVGTDMLVYGVPIFNSAVSANSLSDLVQTWDRIELGYLWLNFFVASITKSHNYFFFLIMFLEVFFVFLSLIRWRKTVPVWLGMLIFYLLFYNDSLNLIRQYLALSIGFYGIQFIVVRKYFISIFWIVLASQFHSSVWILLMYFPLFWFANRFPSGRSVALFCGAMLFFVIYMQYMLADYLFLLGGKWERASWFIRASRDAKGFPISTFLYYLFLIVISVFNRKKILKRFPTIGNLLYYAMAILFVLPVFEFFAGTYAIRFFVFVTIWLTVFIPIVFYTLKHLSKPSINSIIIAYCFFYWVTVYIIKGAGETQNYFIGV